MTKRVALLAGVSVAVGAIASATASASTVTIGQLFSPSVSCPANTTSLQRGVSGGRRYVVPHSGLITSWSFEDRDSAVGMLELKVGRPAGANKYKIVGQSVAGPQELNMVNTYSAKIHVKKGDIIGIYENGGLCEEDTLAGGDVTKTVMGDAPFGSTKTYMKQVAFRIPVSATILLPPSNTTITKAKIDKTNDSATFHFTASGATRFQCKLIRPSSKHAHFSSCDSPKTYKQLTSGSYKFEVRGVNAAGPDPKPAIKKFTI